MSLRFSTPTSLQATVLRVAGQRRHSFIPSFPTTKGENRLCLWNRKGNQLLGWVHSQEKDFFLTSLAKCHLCMMIYRAAPSCWEVVQYWNLVISLILRAWCWTVGANLHSTINLADLSVPLWWSTKSVGYIHLSLKKETVFQSERALFRFMVLFYLVISVEDIYLKDNRERKNPFAPTLLNFISLLPLFFSVTHNCDIWVGISYCSPLKQLEQSVGLLYILKLCAWCGDGLKIISCIADVTLSITAAKEYWFFYLAGELKN